MNEYAHGARIVVPVLILLAGIACVVGANGSPSWAPWLYVAAGWLFRSAIARRS